jgi:ParB-like chromosome segregation protein Spo0J
VATKKQVEKLKLADDGFQSAQADMVSFLESKKNIFYKIGSKYHLDADELFQESYEVLLTCLRDFCPIFKREDGDEIEVKFNTFFGSRIEMKAMELRNGNPEYKARKAYVDGMDDDTKAEFKQNAPLLVQHIDHAETVNEYLSDEITKAREDLNPDLETRFNRDSFLDEVLTDLIIKEKDDKKKAVLQHVKVGGIMNFQDIAYHFGVTDSRASQLMNELMDAFYTQRIINGDVETVVKDLDRLKLSDARVKTLLQNAIEYSSQEIKEEIVKEAAEIFPKIKGLDIEKNDKSNVKNSIIEDIKLLPYEDVLSEEENLFYPQTSVGMREVNELKFLNLEFRTKLKQNVFNGFLKLMPEDNKDYPIIINKDGFIIDGELRVQAAKAKGIKSLLCITRNVSNEDARVLRVIINNRLESGVKKQLYYAVCALLNLGYSQQKIAKMLNTSRTNVIVYAKVKDKAVDEVKQLFEEDSILITNASACADLEDEQQRQMVGFIQKYGAQWSKGTKFTKLLNAAKNNAVRALEETENPNFMQSDKLDELVEAERGYAERLTKKAQEKITYLESRLKDTTVKLQDNETWLAQRESVINHQQKELVELKEENQTLQREIETSQLLQFADKSAFEDEMKYLKKVYEITEKLSGADNAIAQAITKIDSTAIKSRQIKDMETICLAIEEKVEKLRVSLISKK